MTARDVLIPVKHRRPLAGKFTFSAPAMLHAAEAADRPALRLLARTLAGLGVRARLGGPDGAAVRIDRDAGIAGREAHRLTVRPAGIQIRASAAAGAFYAVQTLRELLAARGKSLAGVRIDDAPDLARRGVYLDCSRGKVPKAKTLKRLIDRLAAWKINELQLYIENTFRYKAHPAIGAGYSPFTAEDILAVQAHCKANHVRLVGSLASFGHMEKILSLPAYRHLAESLDFRNDSRGDLCPTDPASIAFLADLYGEFLPLLEADDFNACCDETRQIGQGRSRKRAEKIGVGRLYLEFVLKIHKLCLKHGKRLNIWGDIILAHPELIPDIPKDIVMLNWDYSPNGSRIDRTGEFAEASLPLVCCPGTNAWQSHGTRMAQANANVAKFARIARRCGAEGLLNTDWGDGGHRNTLGVSLHSFAHGAAHAWGGARVDEKTFTRRFCLHAFGETTGRLAAAIKTLGAMPGSGLYHTIIEPFDRAEPWARYMLGWPAIDSPSLKTPAVRRRLEAMRKLRIPRARGRDEFEAVALAEFDLARRMDLLGCQRALAGRDYRAGKRVGRRTLRAISSGLRAMADDFAALWRSRNKPSRLRDNLAAFRRAAAEADKLAR